MAIRFEWSPLVVSDAEALFKAQNEFVQEHYDLTKPHSNTNFDKWKLVLGYPQDDTKRLEFIRNMANGSTKHGKSLHCLKLTRYEGEKAITAGFIDFEVRQISDKNLKKSTVREIYIRSVIVYESMRRQGCGRKLYHALFQYLSPGDLDVIRLYVVDLNQAAVAFYFKLGFKITQWFFRELGAETKTDPGFKAVFLCMQKLQGEQADSGKHQIALQDMPHLFNEQVVGEIVHVDCEDGGSEWTQCARIRVYDKKSNTFTISHADTDNDDDESLVSDLCVNDLFSSGRLYFDTPPSIFLNKGITPCSQIITKSDMAEPSRWPKSGLVQTPEKTRNAEGPRRKRVPWPKSAVSPDGKQESAMDDSSKTLEGPGKGAIVLWAPPLAAVPRHRKQGTQACEYGYEDGKWCKGGTIDFLLKKPTGQQFRVGPWHRISFNADNPKKSGTEAFKCYQRLRRQRQCTSSVS
jgi:ribosomal protein S18 acetylase RimI-like enzyme